MVVFLVDILVSKPFRYVTGGLHEVLLSTLSVMLSKMSILAVVLLPPNIPTNYYSNTMGSGYQNVGILTRIPLIWVPKYNNT